MTNVKQMLTAMSESQLVSPADGSVVEIGPSLAVETTAVDSQPPSPTLKLLTTRLTALFVGEFYGDVPDAGFSVPGLMQVFMTIDDISFSPVFLVRTAGSGARTHSSFLAFKDQIQPGEHAVTVKWRTLRPPPVFIGGRTLTVWETIVAIERPEVVAQP